ncbi:MAG: ROK family protein [Acutalibacteraceae bacterium]|jgi:N-acetylglucosamine repressor
MKHHGLNSEQTKKNNRLLVLNLLCTMQNATRTEITNRIGLAKMTVTNITADLLATGLIYEKETIDPKRQGAGRRQMLLSLSPDSPAVVGVWLSRDFCMGIVAGMNLQVLERMQIDFTADETARTITEKIVQLVQGLTRGLSRKIAGVGIASIGPLEIKRGVILNPPNFYQIKNYPLADELSARLRLPVFLQNDMNAGALAEKYFGAAADMKDFVYLGLTNGIGAGIVMRETLFEGSRGFSGEIGHMSIDCNGPFCQCGNRGCLETFVSVPKIIQQFNAAFGRGMTSFAEVCAFCSANPEGDALMEEISSKLAVALVNLCNALDPEAVIIGHDGAFLNDRDFTRISERVNSRVLAKDSSHIKFLRSSFGSLAPVYGAAVVVLRRIFDGKLMYDEIFPE